MKRVFVPALILSVVGVVLALIAFFGPFGNTGVDGTVGAGLAVAGSVATMVFIAIIMAREPLGKWFVTLGIFAMLASLLTAIASYFLMQYLLAVVMAVTFFVLIPLSLYGRRYRL